jgi:putative ABC transport system permease protein
MWNDLKISLRQLRLNRGFAVIAITTLALGIGANTAIFTIMNTIMLRPLPYPEPGRLVSIYRTSPQSSRWPHAVPDYLEVRAQSSVFEKTCAYIWHRMSLANPGEPAESVRGLACTADFFAALGTPPELGRTFAADEDQPGRDNVAVISHNFWLHRFGGDRAIVGKTIRLEGKPVEIIGVMPASFDVPQLWSPIEVWRPFAFGADQLQNRADHYISALGRLKTGVTLAQANSELKTIGSHLELAYPESNAKTSLLANPLNESIGDQSSRRFAWLMLGLTGFVLMIACINLANLQLARAAARARELAVRLALGASRFRLMRQLIVESLVISTLGGVAGIFVSIWLSDFLGKKLDRWSPDGMPMPLDWRVLTFALACAILTGLFFGAGPAWSASRSNMNETLKAGARGSTSDRSQNFSRHALIVGQVALALVLLTGSALFTGGLKKFVQQKPGWNPDGLIMGWMPISSKYPANEGREFNKLLEDRLRAIPGVREVSLSSSMPIWAFGTIRYFNLEGQPLPEAGQEPLTSAESVTPDYFQTMGIRLKQGRPFTIDDNANHPEVIIINEAMAQKFWPGQNPIGQRIQTGDRKTMTSHEIVGVVSDLHFPANLNRPETLWQTYRPLAQEPRGSIFIELRAIGSVEPIIAAVRRTVAEIDPDLPVNELDTARATIDRLLGHFSLAARILTAFSYLGLTLAGLGIYGVISYLVIQRMSEIGIRMALGATAQNIATLLLSRAMLLAGAGIVIGAIAATLVAKALAAAVPEVPAHDIGTNITVCLAVIAVTLAAVAGPAIKAMRVDPATSLRNE